MVNVRWITGRLRVDSWLRKRDNEWRISGWLLVVRRSFTNSSWLRINGQWWLMLVYVLSKWLWNYLYVWSSKEVLKSNFRQYGEMKSRAGKRHREEKDQKRKSKRTEDTDSRKGRKVAKHCVFPMICGSGGSKSRLAKAGAEPAGQRRDEKLHAVVVRSTFPSENVQNTPFSHHFWKLWCRKSARRCGAKHISKSKVLKTDCLAPLLEVQMSKKCQKSAHRCGTKHISKSKV